MRPLGEFGMLMSLAATPAIAAPCPNVRHSRASSDSSTLGILSAQVGRPVQLAGSYEQGRWRIYDVTADGDHGYVFFNGPPRATPKAYVWAGSGLSGETADILKEVRRHAPGIPLDLARCFARRVTGVAR